MDINPQYVLAPFHSLLGDCQNNVLLGLRIAEKIDRFPAPTQEELQLIQLVMHRQATDFGQSKAVFKKWILRNGFEDIHKCLRLALERLFIYKRISDKIKSGESFDIENFESELKVKIGRWDFPELIKSVDSSFADPLHYEKEILSINKARNCLVHANGIVTLRSCNNIEKDKLTISGVRFKLFFKKNKHETMAKLGKQGPENAALLLGAEQFKFDFEIGAEILLDLKQFVDILNTCIFVKADIEEKLTMAN